ncbi:MAG: L-seryl-tRNA(Sec) selenium transferase [Acidobacteria bacterium]|nr:L-seryl-tRNA(Sec) selenium transferase [Acidobacteriota bacterium]
MPDFRIIPSIEQLRQRDAIRVLEARYGRDAIIAALRAEAEALRARLAIQPQVRPEDAELNIMTVDQAIAHIERSIGGRLAELRGASLGPVINATGVIVHTNLGRAPLAAAAAVRVAEIAAGYANLEYDLERGARGARDVHAEQLLCALTGAEAAVVVNNNAAATLLMLTALAATREVVISRGELVEIGGGFRVPDVMAQSGATLREVGTTNRTRSADYAAAIGERTAAILRVHPSNFRIEGFAERPRLEELVAIGRRLDVLVLEDLGSGLLGRASLPPSAAGALAHEPMVPDSIAAGADVVCFSGDKLLGGPQAGILMGRRQPIERIRRHPLMRALRVDKMTYAAFDATLEEHAAGRAADTIPVMRMITMPATEIETRARHLATALQKAGFTTAILDGVSTIGGGSAPGSAIRTRLLAIALPGESPDALWPHWSPEPRDYQTAWSQAGLCGLSVHCGEEPWGESLRKSWRWSRPRAGGHARGECRDTARPRQPGPGRPARALRSPAATPAPPLPPCTSSRPLGDRRIPR